MAVALGGQCREQDVHRPSPVFAALGAELPAPHEDHVGRLRHAAQRIPVQQIGANRFNAGLREPFEQTRAAETRNAYHELPQSRLINGPFRAHGETRPHLAAHPENKEIAIQFLERLAIAGSRPGKRLFQLLRSGNHLVYPNSGPVIAYCLPWIPGQALLPRNIRTNGRSSTEPNDSNQRVQVPVCLRASSENCRPRFRARQSNNKPRAESSSAATTGPRCSARKPWRPNE